MWDLDLVIRRYHGHKQIARKRRPESQRMFNKTKKMWNEFLAAYPEAKDWVAYDPFK